VTYHV
jgi:hypothetical protein